MRCLTTFNPTNHVVAEDDEEYHGRDVVSVDGVGFKNVGFVPIWSLRDIGER